MAEERINSFFANNLKMKNNTLEKRGVSDEFKNGFWLNDTLGYSPKIFFALSNLQSDCFYS